MALPPAFRKSLPNEPPKHPGALLPASLWRVVLNNLLDPNDVKACSETCLAFKTLLDKTKQYWSFQLLFPLILPRLDLHSALNCRLVCNYWQRILDWLGDNSQNNVPLNLRDPKNLQALLDKKQVLKDCRIIGGAVAIGPVGVAKNGYWNDAWTCLRDHGSKIKSLELHNPGSGWEYCHDILHLSIHMTLRQCPNLRKLKLEDDVSICPAAANDMGTDMVRENYPLPDLVQLEYLLLEPTVPKSIQRALLERYAPRLKWIRCTIYPDMDLNVIPTLVNLTILQVAIYRLVDVEDDANIRNLLLLPPQHLQTLSLQLWHPVNLEIGTLLQICGHFPNLSTLTVSGCITLQLVGQLPPEARKFRSVKYIEFVDVEGVQSFDFLQCFPSLEHLALTGVYAVTPAMRRYDRRGTKNITRPHYGVRNGVRETVQIREFLYPEDEEDYVRMYESNLWVICPRLTSFTFQYSWSKSWKGAEDGPGLKAKVVRRCTRDELWQFYGF